MLAMIWAQAHERAIGKNGTLPWNVPEDMAFFKRVTIGHPVIMGRKTWESLDPRWRPLPGRQNVVVTRNPDYCAPGAVVCTSLKKAYAVAQAGLQCLTSGKGDKEERCVANGGQENPLIWLIGGGELFLCAIEEGLADMAAVTELDITVPGATTFAPYLPPHWRLVESIPEKGWNHSKRSGINYRFLRYER